MTASNDINARIARAKTRDELSPVGSDSRKRLRDHIASILGWIAATIVALNAGGLATAIGMIERLEHPFLISSGFFAGLMLMLAGAICAIVSSLEHIGHLEEVADARLSGSEEPLGDRPLKYWMISAGLATLSLLAFIASAFSIVLSYRDGIANDKRCLAIQRDMLSSMPLRSDDPDLFQALGCKPQGEGSVYAERDTKDDADAMIEQSARRSELPYRNPYRRDGRGAVLK